MAITNLVFEGLHSLGKALGMTVSSLALPGRMRVQEARNILQVPENYSRGEIKDRYERLYRANSRENSGSKYIQSKVKNAYAVLRDALDSKGRLG